MSEANENTKPAVIVWGNDNPQGGFITPAENLELALSQQECPGTHKFVVCPSKDAHTAEIVLRRCGYEIRDSMKWYYAEGGRVCSMTVVVGRLPLEGTVAENVLRWGAGALNVDKGRVPTEENLSGGAYAKNPTQRLHGESWGSDRNNPDTSFKRGGGRCYNQPLGRFPANILHDGSPEAVGLFPSSDGSGRARTLKRGKRDDEWGMADLPGELRDAGTGSAARFFFNTSSLSRGAEGLVAYLQSLVEPPRTKR